MANRYWVGTGSWTSSNTTNWSASSGGTTGASVPTSIDDVFFDSSSGTCSIGNNVTCRSINCAGFAGTIVEGTGQFGLSIYLSIYGSITLSSTMSVALSSGSFIWYMRGGSGTYQIDTKGKTISTLSLDNSSGTFELASSLTTKTVSIASGTFATLGYAINTGSVSIATFSNSATLSLGSSQITLSGSGTCWDVTGSAISINPGASTILLSSTTSSASRVFNGGSKTYNRLVIADSLISTTTISGSNTFGELASTKTSTHTIKFAGGTTNRIGTWGVNGTLGNRVTITSTSTTPSTLVYTGTGVVAANFLDLAYSAATPAETWYAGDNSIDSGNNTGWVFTVAPAKRAAGLFFGCNF